MSKYVFTCWELPKFNKWDLCDFMIYQSEICPTTLKIHYQGYIEFKKYYKLNQVKSLFKEKKMYVDESTEINSRERNIIYCGKDKTYSGGVRFIYSNSEITKNEEDNLDDKWAEFDKMFSYP